MTILEQLKKGDFAGVLATAGPVMGAVLVALAAWLIGRALRLAIQRVLAYDKRALVDRTTIKFLGQVAQTGVYLIAFISYAHSVPALKGLGGAWLTGATVISAVIGLAAQNTLSNLIAGFSLVLYRPFKVGDRLHVTAPTGLETGEVESINLGYTVLKTDDNRRIVVPNSVIATQVTVNLTGDDPRTLCSVAIGIASEADIDQARSILLDLAAHNPKAQNVCGCPVTQVGPSGVTLTLSAWCASAADAADLKSAVLEEAAKRFTKAGIALGAPRQVVTVRQDGGTQSVERGA